MRKKHISAFDLINVSVLTLVGLSCLLPLLNVLAESFSKNEMVLSGSVTLWPKGFTFDSYKYVLNRSRFWLSMLVTVERELLALPLSLLVTVLAAYPLSKRGDRFTGRTAYVWFLFFTTLFSGGTIAWYMNIKTLGLIDSIFALVWPCVLNVFYILLMLNFFRSIPAEMEEAAIVDGAGHFRILFQFFVPVSMPVIATVSLYIIVWHWNSWFDGMVLMQSTDHYPLSSYLRSILLVESIKEGGTVNWEMYRNISNRTVQSAQMFVALVPIILVYPYLQRFFVKGIMLGSIKG